jgi:hypothetical protein
MTRAEQLHAFIMAVEGKAVEWGRDDCTTWAAAWVKEVTGKEVPLLGSYSTLDEAHTIIDEAGGLDVLWTMALAPLNIHETPFEPQLGDVGIVNTSRLGHVGVIFAQDGIALWRAIQGTALLRPRARDIVKVWALPA